MIDVVIDMDTLIVGDDEQKMTMSTIGRMRLDEDCVRLYYDEETQEGESVETVIKVEGGFVMIQRNGANQSCLTVTEGKRFVSDYTVGGLSLLVGIKGKKVFAEFNENSGKIRLEYDVDMNSQFISKNAININVRRM